MQSEIINTELSGKYIQVIIRVIEYAQVQTDQNGVNVKGNIK